MEIPVWLRGLGLGKYEAAFRENDIDETLLDAVAGSTRGALPLASPRRAAMASSSFTRCPSEVTPSSLRFSCVRLGRTEGLGAQLRKWFGRSKSP
jgi:hypothetical protein